ncbi:RCC1 domain-containing protein, partial [Bradyrhizobium sp. NBAIM08]|uniref:RCC1 domain-containing protein n=1 Tax=Bradyrhizobium sp. NBAIM08 TaxID=2793815 RepID=UPI0034D3697A|nr:chromosome condensation regulator RCC1 [Bradyrhizobium sp. NBAIM08]
ARRTAAPVSLPDGAHALAVADHHACAVIGSQREVYCWGDNRHGQLGDGGTAARATPVATGLVGVTRLTAGGSHTCAVTADGSLWCWGRGRDGELGTGTMMDHAVPVQTSLAGVTAIGAGDAVTCASAGGATY